MLQIKKQRQNVRLPRFLYLKSSFVLFFAFILFFSNFAFCASSKISDALYNHYVRFANDRKANDDNIDYVYFTRKAKKLKAFNLISPANPLSFGIIPEDLTQFLHARERLKNISSNDIINNDADVLVDAYVAYDCWLEGFENNLKESLKRSKRCRDRYLDDVRALESKLSIKTNAANDFSSFSNINQRYDSCQTCSFLEQGYLCNALYFKNNSIDLIDKMDIVIQRIKSKMLYSELPVLMFIHYSGQSKDTLLRNRIHVIYNFLNINLAKMNYVKPVINLAKLSVDEMDKNQKLMTKNAISVCVKLNAA